MRVTEPDSEQMFNLSLSDGEMPDADVLTPEELHQLISELPDGCRTVVNLYIFEGYSHRQIAQLLNISESTSSSQLYYAKQVLARRIKELKKDR